MPLAQPTNNRVQFVALEYLHWPTGATEGTRSWGFEHTIDNRKLSVGSKISIMRERPPQASPLPRLLQLSRPSNSRRRPPSPLLEGAVLGIKEVAEGIVTFTISDDFAGGLSTLRVPARATTLGTRGGVARKALSLSLGQGRGWTLQYPTLVEADSLQRPKKKRAQPRAPLLTFAPFDDSDER
ncbi:hypothetical protein FIBSPDRAFT_970546 [Athelia psychrophila]|uniref:Uncharacterized protein n=1 Tax=Athelia psychrophila TaxID=1759441 RepID=A0A167SMG4_9AGAM|nr:hypothetical protein FIBSPDRAFT_970546 [Fibularhizoctonia sp. CBS 109695]